MAHNPPKSPQQKKALSLKRDCRNTYGENDKASRKAIPLRKALENRKVRHKSDQQLSQVGLLDEATIDLIGSSVRHDIYRVGGWTKAPDEPLEKVIIRAKDKREYSVGRKRRTREERAHPSERSYPSKG